LQIRHYADLLPHYGTQQILYGIPHGKTDFQGKPAAHPNCLLRLYD
jgi:hypothetical protein